MLTFNPPISVTPPAYKGKAFPSVQVSELNYDIEYSDVNRKAFATLVGFGLTINLWSGDAYTAAGEFTTADTDSRLMALLGENPGSFISSLLVPRPTFRFGPTVNAPQAQQTGSQTGS